MNTRTFFCILTLASAVPALAGGTVTLDLLSPQSGLNLRDGEALPAIEWTITAKASAGDNMGFACVSVDLVQDLYNADSTVLRRADAVPTEMAGFDRPAGISNPVGGYLGTQRGGYFGAVDIVQIGGAQNTFGAPPTTQPPLSDFGLDVDVDANVGQTTGGQIVASGSFTPPMALGTYRFSIESPIVNTLDYVNAAPKGSPASPATVTMGPSGGEITFTQCITADADGSFDVTVEDVAAFVDLLVGEVPVDAYTTCAVDLNDDGNVNGEDIQPFIETFLGQ